MTLVPQRTAVAQVAAHLQREIAQARWGEWLPNERELCRELQVSRSTLRLALKQLHRLGATQPLHGVGHRIVAPPPVGRRPAVRSLGLLAPTPLARLPPTLALWMDELKDLLHAAGTELRFYHAPSCFKPTPRRALTRLLQHERHAGWILVLSTEAMQHWFLQHEVPCLIAGSLHPGIELPSVDLDYRAIARHAAGVLLQAGHRRISLLNRRLRGAGEIASETGFAEAARASPHPGVEPTIVHYDETRDSVVAAVRQLLDRQSPPTGLVLAGSNFYLSTVTELARRGVRIPGDLSVISRDDDPFLNYVVPPPARYLSDPQVFARKLLPLALHLVEHGSAPVRSVRILPRFETGGSVAAPPRGTIGR